MQLTVMGHTINIDGIYDNILCSPERYIANENVAQISFAQSRKQYECQLDISTGTRDKCTGRSNISDRIKLMVTCKTYNELDHLKSVDCISRQMSCHELTEDDLYSALYELFAQTLTRNGVILWQ